MIWAGIDCVVLNKINKGIWCEKDIVVNRCELFADGLWT